MWYMRLIQFCNENQGFMAALLSVLSLGLSVIAIAISIKTSKIPYKKSVVLGSTYDYSLSSAEPVGFSASVVNVGNRIINVSFLGLGFKEGKSLKKLFPINDIDFKPQGLLPPTEIKEVRYRAADLSRLTIPDNKKLFVIMIDSEGRTYKKKIGKCATLKEVYSNQGS